MKLRLPNIRSILNLHMNNHINASQEPEERFVTSRFIARKYGITERYVLQMAASQKIPSLRIGRQCVRFDEQAVAAVLEGVNPQTKNNSNA